MSQKLTTTDHSRDIAGLKYVYPVISRRAGGLSIGINFNTNNACNWRCVYCQVPDLVRGSAPELNFKLLEEELRFFLNEVLNGDFFDQFNVAESLRIIKDIAISGNGEPTSVKGFDKAVALIADIATEFAVLPGSHFVLITNGSLIHQTSVQAGLRVLNNYKGQVWFKLDSATEQGRLAINDNKLSNEKTLRNLEICSALCETYLQTCMLDYDECVDAEEQRGAFFELLKQIKQAKFKLKKIMLYTIARPSLQPEAEKLKRPAEEVMLKFAKRLEQLGYEVSVSI